MRWASSHVNSRWRSFDQHFWAYSDLQRLRMETFRNSVNIPLIHGADGAKLSKRHGALWVGSYRDMWCLPEAVCNCLLHLAGCLTETTKLFHWKRQSSVFQQKILGKTRKIIDSARLDFKKLENLNGYYIRQADDDRLMRDLTPLLDEDISEEQKARIGRGMNGLKQRAKTLLVLRDMSQIYTHVFFEQDNRPPKMMNKHCARSCICSKVMLNGWSKELETKLRKFRGGEGVYLSAKDCEIVALIGI